LSKVLRIQMLIFQKCFQIEGIIKLCLGSISMILCLLFVKLGLLMIPTKSIFQVYWLIAASFFLLPVSNVVYTDMNDSHKKMVTYFKNIPLSAIQTYFIYRKFVLFVFWSFFLFFPFSAKTMVYGVAALALLGIGTMVVSSVQCTFKDTKKTNYATILVKCCMIFPLVLLSDGSEPLMYVRRFIESIPIYYYVFIILLSYTITYKNVSRSYMIAMNRLERKAQYTFIKNHHFLYMLRTGMGSALFFMLVTAFIGFDRSLLDVVGFGLVMVSSYDIIYTSLLRNEQGKIHLLYKPTTLHLVRWNKLDVILKFSSLYLVLAVVLGLYTNNVFGYVVVYALVVGVFSLTVLTVKINIEKRKDNRVVTWQDMLKLALISTTGAYLVMLLL